MQSGISASQELRDTFNIFVSNPKQRALLVGIENEALIPVHTTPVMSTFSFDLDELHKYLSATEARYILLKVAIGEPDGFAAVTFVPNAAPVRQKMLFASTRLTLVRELGIERFRETLFATELNELTSDGWQKHEAHTKLEAPLTEEEQALGSVKEAEAAESQGTAGRRMHAENTAAFKLGEGVVEALQGLKQPNVLVQLKFMLPDETLRLDLKLSDVSPSALSSSITLSEPRYSFFSYPGKTSDPSVLFIYTCPTSSTIKERMTYSTAKVLTRKTLEREAGISITKTLEASDPADLTPDDLGQDVSETAVQQESKTFARPKRPGRK